MRILYASVNYGERIVGGAQMSIRYVAEELCHEHDVGILYISDKNCSEKVLDNGIRLFEVPHKNIYYHLDRSNSRLKRLLWHMIDRFSNAKSNDIEQVLSNFKPDVIHTNVLSGLSVSIWNVAKKLNIPIVHTVHDYYLTCANSGMRSKIGNCSTQCSTCTFFCQRTKVSSKYVDGVIYVSEHMQKVHEQNNVFRKNVLSDIIIGSFPHASKKTYIQDEDHNKKITLGFLGRIAPDKGLDNMFKGLAKLASNNFILLLGGEGNASYIEQLKIKTAHIPFECKFLGRVSPTQFFSDVDVVIVPSTWNEPASRVIYESGLNGVPAIVSRRGGSPELVGENERGWVYEPSKPEQLAEIINTIAEKPGLIKERAEAWTKIKASFLPEQISNRTLAFYDRCTTK